MGSKQLHSRGFTLIASLMLLFLLSAFALSLMYMVNTESHVGGSDLENGIAYHAAEGGMEKMTADLANLFASQQAPTPAAIAALQGFPPAIGGVTYPEYQIFVPTNPDGSYKSTVNTIKSGQNAGLVAEIVPMTLSVTAQRPLGDQVRMIRTVEVALIPVFQFGVFSDGDLSYFPGPAFDFAGRVHTNGNLFLADGGSLTLHSKVSAVQEVIRAELANGYSTSTNYTGPVYIPQQAAGCDGAKPKCRSLALTEGSKVAGPTSANNPNWSSISMSTYNSYVINGRTGATPLSLPFVGGGAGPIQIIRRPPPNELPGSSIGVSRLYNQAQIRVQLSDDPAENHPDGSPVDGNDIQLASQEPAALQALRPAAAGLAGSAQPGINVAGVAGLSYFGEAKWNGATGSDANYIKPRYIYARDAAHLFPAAVNEWPQVDGWLRVEVKQADGTWLPVTAEWLQLGFARGLQSPNSSAGIPNSAHPRAILIFQQLADRNGDGVLNNTDAASDGVPAGTPTVTGANSQYNWQPINMYDPREGEVRDTASATCALNGIMNVVELDVRNLQQWLYGAYGGNGTRVDWTKQNGYVLYYSDRRGMILDPSTAPLIKTGRSGIEDVVNSGVTNGLPDGTEEAAENVAGVGNAFPNYFGEVNLGDGFGKDTTAAPASATRPDPFINTRVACTTIARKNRVTGARHVLRLVDGTRGNLPQRPSDPTKGGFTVASENPVYVLGDYNAKTSEHGYNDPHSAAAIIADSVTLLSNNYNTRVPNGDINSFQNPTTPGNRSGTETYYRMAIAAGKNINFPKPSWGAQDFGTDGGLHNFLRYIESWGAPLHYQGSLVSLYYSQYATGVFKCCTTVYGPPTRDYSFDLLFLNPDNLPPGTPLFRDVDNVSYRQDFTPY